MLLVLNNAGADHLAGTGWAYPRLRGPRSDILVVPDVFSFVGKMDGKCLLEESKIHNFIDTPKALCVGGVIAILA